MTASIYGGNVVIASSAANFSQIHSLTVSEGKLEELRTVLSELGLDRSAFDSLKRAMEDDAKLDAGKPTLGEQTKSGFLTPRTTRVKRA
ncbi:MULTISPECIES: hypothetical protein [unclassified Chelatococcus]|uniref:hypothetical protein n=1 Tax=unclassified Chelatococcus TaxID=2638111 RepID=UPI001BCC6074|nr:MULTISPECIES: hypothetical protein [unclassified Chelatococcus]MBS7738497.1 hypothetical protein [Chelatococcus sp. HY11]MBX3542901.1 hypothetical protein [Chelatococcus sp.]